MDLSIPTDTINYLFASTFANTQGNLDSLAGTILGQGIDYFQDGEYEKAAKSFRQAAALSPYSDNAVDAYNYLGQAYIKLEKTDEAIKTYQEAISYYPTDDSFYLALGDIYLGKGMLEEAGDAYEAAVRINPNNAESQYSLGQAYLKAGELNKANERFAQVVRISPANASGYYGLGQAARASGDLNEAVSQLNKSIRVNKDFELAYLELGYACADMGDFSRAEDHLAVLKRNDSGYQTDLENYIAQVTQPGITAALSFDGFNTTLGPNTQVSRLSSSLTDANKSRLFSMTVTFSKDMDAASVVSSRNWTISRATIRNNGGVYNYGLPPLSSEASIPCNPAYVLFDDETNMATVYFRISQNQDADATMDPNHIVFKFSGVDAYGRAMDSAADEYSGFSGIA